MRQTIRFIRQGRMVELADIEPTALLLDYLRDVEGRKGTKEGCGEGDCGACTVALGRLRNGRLVYEPVNSCIQLLGQVDGSEIVTVEDLAAPDDGKLHPVQAAMVEKHGSQCGFCTPGFVMALFALYHSAEAKKGVERDQVNDWIAGNLCRCTGYRPIVDAALAACAMPRRDRFTLNSADTAGLLSFLTDNEDIFVGDSDRFFAAPGTVDGVADLFEQHPDATLVAGATDVGLWITKRFRDLPKIIYLGRAKGLDHVADTGYEIMIGAAATYAVVEPYFRALDPDLGEILRRLGSKQVRASGTVGGNVANASPIGDTPPVLIALEASLELRKGKRTRSMPIEDFFIDYGKQARERSEFVTGLLVPKLAKNHIFRCFKVSKRFDQDISSVMGAFRFTVKDDGKIEDARIAFGGMAGIPKRARGAEAALRGALLRDSRAWAQAFAALRDDFSPIDDHRASARYRQETAHALLGKALIEAAGTGTHRTRVIGRREVALSMDLADIIAGSQQPTVVRAPHLHDSAAKHVTGEAVYIDDIREPVGTLHLAPGYAAIAAGRVTKLDLDTVKKAPGVVAVLTAADIPGTNDVSPKQINDDPAITVERVMFYGQVLFVVVAEKRDQARRAARLARITTAPAMPVIDVDDARVAGATVLADYAFVRGEPRDEIAGAPKEITGEFRIGGQEHFYLEGQVALAIPGEDGDMLVHSSTQHPSEVQHVVAHVLGLDSNAVTVEVRRMGGGFGGKESQATQWAVLAALGAWKTKRPCKMRLDRDDDMIMTGKRHDFRVDYNAGFTKDGVLRAVDVTFSARCGYSEDLSLGVVDRTMFHADNAYFYPAVRILSHRMRTNTVSNTAFRGFGGPQGMLFAERMMDHIAYTTGRDPLEVRKANFYGGAGRDRTPYGMRVEDNVLQEIVADLERSSDYWNRRKATADYNASSPVLKKGLALTPVKFGISFTLIQLNQAGALVHLYRDGSITLNHGGTEMGQGLFVKVAQTVAEEFGVGLDRVKITATSTAKVPNTGPTAASAGTDLNAQAAVAACRTIKERLFDFIHEKWGVGRDRIQFREGKVFIGNQAMELSELANAAHIARVSLSSTGFYKTPKIHWDREKVSGRPFLYFAYGAACSEVTIDTMTGEMKIDRVDILHDVGKSLNPAIDIGQIEGGFIQGVGWLTTEELVWDSAGRLLTHAPSTYKIPTASDVPADFRVALYDSGGNREDTIYRSKAVGEPPLMLAISVFSAINDAIASLKPAGMPRLDAPATPEAIMRAVRATTGGDQ